MHKCEECSYFILKKKEQRKTMRSALNGESIDWKKLDFSKEKCNTECTFSSFGNFIYYGVNDPKILNILKNECKEKVSVIKYIENDLRFHILSGITTVDALDLENSEYDSLDENRITFIDKYVLKSKLIEELYLFRLKRCGGLFCTNLFKELYEKEKWSGFQFEKVWEKDLTTKKLVL
jgi:hypothetical protein